MSVGKYFLKYLFFISFYALFVCCQSREPNANDKAIKRIVEVRNEGDKFNLYVNGSPYYIKGAGGYSNFKAIKEAGGNSVRIWEPDRADEILDEAYKNGLSVILGLDVGRPRLGFDYGDEGAVKKQLDHLKSIVLKYKDHPALLMWGVGNEVDGYSNDLRVWVGVNDIAKMIHEVDPHHPTTTTTPPKDITLLAIKYLCPEIDVLSINTFGALYSLKDKLNESIWGWNKAYIVSEWGPRGYWETDSTLWGAPIESNSSDKAKFGIKNYKNFILGDTGKCLGSYVFFWGHKTEKTPTWYSLFLESNEKTNLVSSMELLWKGKITQNQAPDISNISIDGKYAIDNIYMYKGLKRTYEGKVECKDPEKDSLTYRWEILEETKAEQKGGDSEERPPMVKGAINKVENNKVKFWAPWEVGAYRLYVYVYDGKGNVATANCPFYVLNP